MSNTGVQKDISNLQYKVGTSVEGDKPLIEVEFQGRKKMISPEEISAMVRVLILLQSTPTECPMMIKPIVTPSDIC